MKRLLLSLAVMAIALTCLASAEAPALIVIAPQGQGTPDCDCIAYINSTSEIHRTSCACQQAHCDDEEPEDWCVEISDYIDDACYGTCNAEGCSSDICRYGVSFDVWMNDCCKNRSGSCGECCGGDPIVWESPVPVGPSFTDCTLPGTVNWSDDWTKTIGLGETKTVTHTWDADCGDCDNPTCMMVMIFECDDLWGVDQFEFRAHYYCKTCIANL